MNPQSVKPTTLLISLLMLCSLFTVVVNADSIPNPAVDQKKAIDHMHHKLHDDQASYKAQEIQFLKELNEMTVKEDVRLQDVNAKIGELMAAKAQIMRLRYDHLIEMRAILSDEQKVGYDKGVLSRSAVK
jgi:hypothetical protein